MKNHLFCIVSFVLCVNVITAQNTNQGVALVLSGGAARGITHIGVIKALEENNIPIDYIAGTSMGAIVGGLYASGWTCDEMAALISSAEFSRWMRGETSPRDRYFYRAEQPTPTLMEISGKHKSDRLIPLLTSTSIEDPTMINLVVLQLFAKPNAACQSNFDSLMIPFRCVAADVEARQEYVFRKGDLGDAVRASMSYPGMFRAVEADGKILYDGGLFNNFPVDVARNEFHPKYIIGSCVARIDSSDIDMRDEAAIIKRLLQQPTDYSLPDGTLLQFPQDKKTKAWDFSQVDKLVQLGYDSTMAHINDIRAAVHSRRSTEEIESRRKHFKEREPEIEINHIEVNGVSEAQERYLESVVRMSGKEWDTKSLSSAYFRLLSDRSIAEIVPHTTYDSASYTLHLDIRTRDRLCMRIGGNLSSSLPLQGYVGIDYDNFRHFPFNAWADLQVGRIYNAATAGLRWDITPRLYIRNELVAHLFNYYDDNRIFYYDAPTSMFRQREYYLRIAAGLPIGQHTRFEAGTGIAFQHDIYRQNNDEMLLSQHADHSRYWIFQVYGKIESNTLNHLMYPTEGHHWSASLRLPASTENAVSSVFPENDTNKSMQWWLQAKAHWDGYFPMGRHFSLGAETELVWSTRNMLGNYTATIISSPHFAPTPHARSTYNTAFSAKQYAAAGLKPVVRLNARWQIRVEGYVFAPLFDIESYSDNTAYYSKFMHTVRFMSESSMVYTFNRGAASLYANWYSTPQHDWNIGINLGILMFHDKFLD